MTPAEALTALREAGLTVAAAESLTGGELCAALSMAPGSSAVFLGGVVTYTVATKQALLGVDASLLETFGPVDPRVAAQMADRVASLTGSDIGVATTGVAGPEPHGGHSPGFAYVAWRAPGSAGVLEVHAEGDRATVRARVTTVSLEVIAHCSRGGTVVAEQLSVTARRVERE